MTAFAVLASLLSLHLGGPRPVLGALAQAFAQAVLRRPVRR